jgi:hypothetical protein
MLICRNVSDEEKKFYNNDTRWKNLIIWTKMKSIEAEKVVNKLACLTPTA